MGIQFTQYRHMSSVSQTLTRHLPQLPLELFHTGYLLLSWVPTWELGQCCMIKNCRICRFCRICRLFLGKRRGVITMIDLILRIGLRGAVVNCEWNNQ